MLDIQIIRDHPERVRVAMQDKGYDDTTVVDRLVDLDAERRATQTDLQELQHRANTVSREIGELMRKNQREEAQERIEESGRLKQRVKDLEEAAREKEREQERLLLEIPNLPHESVPVGATPAENEVLREEGEKPSFDFEPQPHWTLAEEHELIDFERGAKVTGAGFPFYLGRGARLQRALLNFFLDLATEEGGYTEMQAPLMVNELSARGTGQLPDKEGLMYKASVVGADADRLISSFVNTQLLKETHEGGIEAARAFQERFQELHEQMQNKFDLYLIPTAELPVTNFLRDEILEEADLPRRYCAYTPCFRREAGSYGKDVRGLNRLHQFDKVELVHFVHPDHSYDVLEQLLADAERPLQRLDLPYRVLSMCTGDMGFTQTKKYDLEVWSPGQERWLEVSSVSNFEAFQARRMGIRYRPEEGGKPQFVHTLNGSGLAFPRVVAALLEHYQQADGSIVMPEALQPFTGFDRIG